MAGQDSNNGLSSPFMGSNLGSEFAAYGKVEFYINTYRRKRRGAEDEAEIFLQDVEGHVEPGTVCAVIGPKGSGKHRLLQLLSGRTQKHICLGEVHVNGDKKTAAFMNAMTSYLANAGSSLVNEMSVREAVDFTARLVLPSEVSGVDRAKQVERVLEETGLIHVQSRRIGARWKEEGISAEDRVRVNLAQLLIEKKFIIFLDEPTRSLDLLAAEKIISDIIELAELKSLTIFLSIEHPSKLLLEKFHKALFLSKGKQVYFGRVKHTVDFFSRLGHPIPEETSIYDHILSLTVQSTETGERSQIEHLDTLLLEAHHVFQEIQMAKLGSEQKKTFQEFLVKVRHSNDYIRLDADAIESYGTGWCGQFAVLVKRFWSFFIRDVRTYTRFVLYGAWVATYCIMFQNIALSKDYIASQDIVTALTLGLAGFQALSMLVLSQSEDAARTFESDMHQNLYRPSAYVVAYLLAQFLTLPLLVAPSVIAYFYILQWDKNQQAAKIVEELLFFGVAHLFVAVISEVAMLCVAFLSYRNHQTMYAAAGALHFIWVLFSGGVIRFCGNMENVFVFLAYTSPTKWALDGLLTNTVRSLTFQQTANGVTTAISGGQFLDTDLCFNRPLAHAQNRITSFIALSSMLGVMILVFYVASRMIGNE